MTIIQKFKHTVLIKSKISEDTNMVQYTAEGVEAIVDNFIVTNNGSESASITINIVTKFDNVDASNRVINSRNLDVGETYTCPEIVGQVLLDRDCISTIASLPTTLTIRSSGREIII